jgi:hypothetical protein
MRRPLAYDVKDPLASKKVRSLRLGPAVARIAAGVAPENDNNAARQRAALGRRRTTVGRF